MKRKLFQIMILAIVIGTPKYCLADEIPGTNYWTIYAPQIEEGANTGCVVENSFSMVTFGFHLFPDHWTFEFQAGALTKPPDPLKIRLRFDDEVFTTGTVTLNGESGSYELDMPKNNDTNYLLQIWGEAEEFGFGSSELGFYSLKTTSQYSIVESIRKCLATMKS